MNDQSRPAGSARCSSCEAPLTVGQRYCLECGARNASLPAGVASWLKVRDADDQAGQGPPAPGADGSATGAGAESDEEESLLDRYMPTPQIAAVAVMALLAAGVVLGAVTDPLARSASAPIVLLGSPASAPKEEAEPEPVEEEVVEEAAPEARPEATAPPEVPPPAEGGEPLNGSEEKPPEGPPELPPEAALPPVTHVFMIVLGDQGYEATFGKKSTSPYLSKTLAKKGEVLSNYYAVAQGDLANEIALLSGQGPTVQTAANCPEYTDVSPGTVAPTTVGTTEAVEGAGCVYPAATQTLPGQLTAAGSTWKAYVEDIGNGGPEQATTCRHPAPGSLDPNGAPVPGDAYETWRNPFAYFHSLLDSGECAASDVGLEQLAPDLKKASTEVPALSYIVPNACHDGSEQPCAPGQPAGLAGAESFLETVVPEIEASDAYKAGGLIAITFAQAPQTGPAADPSSCCGNPEYPNLATEAGAPPPAANGPVKPTGGGGRVGLLLISPYVLPGSVNESGYYNHFSLLHSIEELFGLTTLGYAAEPAVAGFDESVYNNLES
jgi:phosphatidylinositol-3-phosphatase